MGSKHFFHESSITLPPPFTTIHKTIPFLSSEPHNLRQTQRLLFSPFASRPQQTSNLPYRPHQIPPPVLEDLVEEIVESEHMKALKQKLSQVGIDIGSCEPGQFSCLLCPMCKGGNSNEKSLSVFIAQDRQAAIWTCFRGKCGWRGGTQAFAEMRTDYTRIGKVNKKYRKIADESLGLEPLCDVLLAFFSERMISRETLRRNGVMQRRYGDQINIAFTYRRDGELVSCKYRDITKKFFQEADTERIFYGLDDIKEASDIIIVEGEMDKLAMEEASFRNCVSVPNGAPASVSDKELPPLDKDTRYQYLWNCKEYLEKASRIILATDGDPPGQALAEELARRLGRERCWRVIWPKRNSIDFKDANEVLMRLGPTALREVVEGAEQFPKYKEK